MGKLTAVLKRADQHFFHLFNKYLVSADCIPRTIPAVGVISDPNGQEGAPFFLGPCTLIGENGP